jgi:hypothetical protein
MGQDGVQSGVSGELNKKSILSDTSYQTAYDEYGDNLRIAAVSQSFIKTSRILWASMVDGLVWRA